MMKTTKYLISVLAGALSLCGVATASDYDSLGEVNIDLFAPAKGDKVGVGGRGWFVDIAVQFEEGLDATGFSDFQITGPGPHDNVAPFPGTFSPGADDRFPGLIVLLKTTTIGAGSCQNLANLFNITGVTNQTEDETEIWDTWIVGAPLFGTDTKSKVFVAVADDLNGDGIYNDAPAVVPDANGDGKCNARDLKALGVVSNIAKAKFYINQ